MDWQITADRPVYLQLIEQLELAIAAGEYPAGARLPAVRELAAQAAVNPNTMQRALQELEARGLVVTQRTAGRCVTGSEAAVTALRRRLAEAEAARFLQQMGRLGCTRAEALAFLQAAEPAEPAETAGAEKAAKTAAAPNAAAAAAEPAKTAAPPNAPAAPKPKPGQA